jgi:hypothetical protein
MKKICSVITGIIFSIFLLACSANKKESAASIAQKWCDLNAKVHNAKTDEEKELAKEARKKFENEMDAKYDNKNNEAMKKELQKEVEKCEAASEGR